MTFRVESYSINQRFVVTGRRGARRATDEYLFSDSGPDTVVQVISTFDLHGPSLLQRRNARAIARHCDRDMAGRLKGLLDGTIAPNTPAAKSPWRALALYLLIAAVLAVIWATYRSLTS